MKLARFVDENAVPSNLTNVVAPSKIVCIGRNYAEHAKELGNEAPSEPIIFLKPPSAVLPPGGTIVRPAGGRGGASATIQNGETRHVTKGDVILIGSGMPHWYKDLDATLTYLEVRFAEK